MRKTVERILSFTLALVMVLGVAMPQLTEEAYAADQTQHGSEGVVLYQHDGLDDTEKRVSYGSVGGYQAASDIYNGGYQAVYCINPSRSATSSERWNANFRWRWNLTANQWLLDNNKRNLSNPDLAPGSAGYDALARILYVGYGTNGGGNSFSYSQTQAAVFYAVTGTGSPNEVNTAAESVDMSGVSYTLYMYLPDSDAKQTIQNTVGIKVWSDTPPTPPAPSGPTASVGFSGRKVLEGAEFDLNQEIQFLFRMYLPAMNGNEAGTDDNGQYHSRRVTGDSSESDPGLIYFGELTFGEGDLGEKTIKFREATPSNPMNVWSNDANAFIDIPENPIEGMVYDDTVFEITIDVRKEGDEIKIYKDGQDVTGQTINVGEWINKIEQPNDEETTPKPGTLKTSVHAGNAVGSDSAEAKLTAEEAASVTKVTDKVDYENLVAGNTYKVEGTLRNVTDGEDVATVCEERKAESASGSWEITFENVKLEAGKKYVVYEKATPVKDSDGSDIHEEEQEKGVIEHKDDNDKAQTIVVEEEPPVEEPKEEEPKEEPPVEEPKEEKPEELPPPNVPSTGNPEPKNDTPTPPANNPPTNNTPSVPNTGDDGDIVIWMAIAAVAVFMAATAARLRRR